MNKHLLTAILCVAATASQGQTDTWTADQLMPESSTAVYTPGTGNEFGYSIDGNTAGVVVAGSFNEEAVVYIRNQSNQQLETAAVLSPTDGGFFDGFGGTVSTDGNTIAVASAQHNSVGAVYVYTGSGSNWTLQQKIEPTDATGSDRFGEALVLMQDKLLIGASGHDSGKGAAYAYERSGSTWNLIDKFVPADALTGDGFGSAVAMNSTSYLATSPNHFIGGGISGAAYVFSENGGGLALDQKLIPTDGVVNDNFGSACSMTDNHVLISATTSTLSGTDAGAVHTWVHNGTTWDQGVSIYPENPSSFEFFGRFLSMYGEDAVIGSPGKNSNTGEATTVKMRGAISIKTGFVSATNGQTGDSYGQGGVMLNNRMAISANYGSSDVTDSGIFETYDWDCPDVDTSITILTNGVFRANYFSVSANYQWFKYDPFNFPEPSYTAIPGATNQEYMPTDNGWYYVVIEQDGCIFSSYVYVINNVGIKEYLPIQPAVVPNPTESGFVRLNFDQKIKEGKVVVSDAVGRIIKQLSFSESRVVPIELNGPSGVYIVRASSDLGHFKPVRIVKK